VKVELEIEEAREIVIALLDRITEETKLSEADRTALRKWRTSMSAGSSGMRDLFEAMNADLARELQNQKRSSVRKPDWR
jgi:predicted transcriptional regulator